MAPQLFKFVFAFAGLYSALSYLCVDNACNCLEDGVLDCHRVKDVSTLFVLPSVVQNTYQRIMIHPDVSCHDVRLVELNTQMEVINIDCAGVGGLNTDKKLDGVFNTNWINYLIQFTELMMIFFSIFIAAKNRHNLLPFVNHLPTFYTSNKTFIKHLFTRRPHLPNISIVISNEEEEEEEDREGGIPLSTIVTSTPIPQLRTPMDFSGDVAAGGVQPTRLSVKLPRYVLYI